MEIQFNFGGFEMKFNKKKYMKKYSYCYQKALGFLRLKHIEEFKKIFKKLLKGGKKNGKNSKY